MLYEQTSDEKIIQMLESTRVALIITNTQKVKELMHYVANECASVSVPTADIDTYVDEMAEFVEMGLVALGVDEENYLNFGTIAEWDAQEYKINKLESIASYLK